MKESGDDEHGDNGGEHTVEVPAQPVKPGGQPHHLHQLLHQGDSCKERERVSVCQRDQNMD